MEKRKRIIERNIRELTFALTLDCYKGTKQGEVLALELMRYEIELRNL